MKTPNNDTIKILKKLKTNKIELIDLKCINLTGRLHHVSLPVHDNIIKDLMHDGVGFDGSSYGFRKVENSDMILIPDLNTAFIDPFRESPTLSFYANIITTGNREPFSQDGRYLAKSRSAA